MGIVDAYIGLGSNLADPVYQLDIAVAALRGDVTLEVRSLSSYYRNPAMQSDNIDAVYQPDYVNAVLQLKTALSPQKLLRKLLDVEISQGRIRTEKHWDSRIIDLDLLLYGDAMIDESNLKVPHPGLPLRSFVLYPLYEIAHDLMIPGMGHLSDILKRHSDKTLQKIAIDEK